jgi:hypothetical protein
MSLFALFTAYCSSALTALFSAFGLGYAFTLSRFSVVFFSLLPIYLFVQLFWAPVTLAHGVLRLLTSNSRRSLIQDAERYRARAASRAESQLRGSFRFREEDLLACQAGTIPSARTTPGWPHFLRFFNVMDANVAYYYIKPLPSVFTPPARTIVLLHGVGFIIAF